MDKKKAFAIVYDELKKCPLFMGIYDATHGHEDFMYGISTVMEVIAYNISEEVADEFNSEFYQNMTKSEERSKK